MGPKHGPYGLLKGRIWYIVGTVYKGPRFKGPILGAHGFNYRLN